MKVVILGILIGAGAGLIGALCGVGGGVLMVPLFVHVMDLTQKQAVATSLAVVIFTSIAATVSNMRSPVPLIQWPLFFAAAASSIIASYFMAERMKQMSNETLTRIFAVVLISAGVSMWFTAGGKKPASGATAAAARPESPDRTGSGGTTP